MGMKDIKTIPSRVKNRLLAPKVSTKSSYSGLESKSKETSSGTALDVSNNISKPKLEAEVKEEWLSPTSKNPDGRDVRQRSPTHQHDLWVEAFNKLPPKIQTKLKTQGMNTNNSEDMTNQIQAFQEEAKKQRERSLAREWKVHIGEHEIPIRKLTVNIAQWAEKIGDVAIQFAPSPGAGVWAVAKSILQKVDTFDKEKAALLVILDKVTGAMFCGQIYYEIYTEDRTGRKDVVDRLQDAIVELYTCVLELLATSTDLASNTAMQICHSIFDSQKPSGMLLGLEELEKALGTAASKCENTAHAHQEAQFKEYLQDAQSYLEKISQNLVQVFHLVSEQERRLLLDRISDVQYGYHYDLIEQRRSLGTGDWLINHKLFIEWIETSSCSTLWLQGSPGAGKTFLTSAVVKHFIEKKASRMEGLAYFFCNRDEPKRREGAPIIRSLVRQLAAPKNKTGAVRESLRKAEAKATDKASQLSSSDCHEQLLESFNLYSTTVIILDALDEVLDFELDSLIEELYSVIEKVQEGSRVKIFVASRPEKGIRTQSRSNATIIIQANDNKSDIEKYVTAEIEKFGKKDLDHAVNYMKDKIVDCILSKSGTMFLWAHLQLRQCFKCDTIESIEHTLDIMPNTLAKTYNQIYQEIQDRPLPDRQLAERALYWILSAPGLLKVDDLLSAICLSIENENVKVKSRVRQEVLISVCENLLIIDKHGYWRFFHLSVREYLEKKLDLGQKANSYCAKVCFLSLMHTFGQNGLDLTSDELKLPSPSADPLHMESNFSVFIQDRWIAFACELHESDETVLLLQKFLGSPNQSSPYFIRWWESMSFNKEVLCTYTDKSGGRNFLHKNQLQPVSTPMFFVAQARLYGILRRWCNNNNFDIFQRNERGLTLFEMAAETNCVQLYKDLVSGAAEYEIISRKAVQHGSPNHGRCLEEEVKIDASSAHLCKTHSSAIIIASYHRSLDVVRYIVETEKTNVNLQVEDEYHGSALVAAVTCPYGSPLNVVHYLVEEAKADVNLQVENGEYGSALVAAAVTGKIDIVKYLVEQGDADVNLELNTGQHGSALAAAAAGWKLEVVQYLVEEGDADVNLELKAGKHGSALAAAAAGCNFEVVQYLVEEAKADVSLQLEAGYHRRAIIAAAVSAEDIDWVRFLMDQGDPDVNPDILVGPYKSALEAAEYFDESSEVAEYLRRKQSVSC
ncbi:Aldehyde dehydrogenase C-terminal [Penicillium nucicola]|uniref:Aldehyde dehydrogenase C-terminal n=1 Tax=Penicillium nucicola TaxID=1850975 RepID=UPI002545A73F|nr:Aldehyde dehydrogenase C-terminal [Penicillium nucicola]KAJ5747857.1 Aldehyde dehydrogenase C-terminal [Penicillium nucicola]